ncbi:MAG TPA: hypothetical protein VFV75_01765 [Candidatus Polarisedimenticolaceae bacterium]|nr:hypothetical protein [Candidatus Polarisedimenticolaceae bacterium]
MNPHRLLALALVLCAPHVHAARQGAPQPTPEETRALAETFAQTVAQRRVALADGSLAWLVAPAGSQPEGRVLLTPERLQQAFDTITEAGAWPSTWLVVRDAGQPNDILISIDLQEGRVRDPEAAFEAGRREWSSGKDIEAALLQVRGDRVSRRPKNVVLVEFSSKTVTTYVYEVKPPSAQDQGLMKLLPQGSLLRAARAVRLADGSMRTLALVLQQATFHPSDCTTCEATLFGHADGGRMLAVLASEQALEEQVDLTPQLHGVDGSALLPRFACVKGDENPAAAELPLKERFADREPVTLLDMKDLDGDGQALEVRLPARYVACGKAEYLVLAVDPRTGKLAVSPAQP